MLTRPTRIKEHALRTGIHKRERTHTASGPGQRDRKQERGARVTLHSHRTQGAAGGGVARQGKAWSKRSAGRLGQEGALPQGARPS